VPSAGATECSNCISQTASVSFPDASNFGQSLPGKLHGAARIADGALDVTRGGHVTFPHQATFDLGQPFTVECWVWLDQMGKMPVIVSCGHWRQAGWFLQRLGNVWRWHVGGIDCDGGQPATGQWTHLVGT
jgi:hypothetical protein